MGVPVKPEEKKEVKPGLRVHIPVNIIRWLAYAVAFFVLLIPFYGSGKLLVWEWICGALILAWFAGQLNEVKENLKVKK